MYLRTVVVILLSVFYCAAAIAQQDTIADEYIAQKNAKELQQEQKELNFTNFFFEALQQKAIDNYEKAIVALEYCLNIKPGETAVLFELSKNYLELENYFEAESYAKKALETDSDNLYILMTLKEIYNKQGNFKAALEIQKKVAELDRNQQVDLVILYIKNNMIDKARELLVALENEGLLSDSLIPFKQSLLKGKVIPAQENNTDIPSEQKSIEELKSIYEKDNSFQTLKFLLSKMLASKDFLDLESESSRALELFPAQPLLYLMNGTALNQQKQYEKALDILLNGLDYVVDDILLEADFYEQISLSYKGLRQNVNASKYYNKAQNLRQKKS